MTEMINHVTVHKELLHDTASQDAFVYDQADSAAALLLQTEWNVLFSRCTIVPHHTADSTFLRVAGSNLAIAIPTALFGPSCSRIPGFQAREALC